MKKIVIVCGPTGIGKTSFSIALSQILNGEIIGADSMQIYKYMDIGTAKPTVEEQDLASHHMIDIICPDEDFDAGMYARMADTIIETLHRKEKLPIIAGGTGLYIKALMYGLFRSRAVDSQVLSDLEQALLLQGAPHLYEKLKHLDPEAAIKIHPNDSFRILRALENIISSGRKISTLQREHQFGESRYNAIKICLYTDRDILYNHINHRVDLMMEQGLVHEVQDLVNRGYSFELKSMQSIGYRHMGMFLKQEVHLDEAVTLLKRDTRRYAKRQLTWFRHQDDFIRLRPDQIEDAVMIVKEFLT